MTDDDHQTIKQIQHHLGKALALLQTLVEPDNLKPPPEFTIDESFLDRRIDTINFGDQTVRIWNTVGYYPETQTVRQVAALSEPELLRFPNFGRKSLACLKETFAAHGVQLGRWPRE